MSVDELNLAAYPVPEWPDANQVPLPLTGVRAEKYGPLPEADAVILLWDQSDWAAFRHVFQAADWEPYRRNCLPTIHRVELLSKLDVPEDHHDWGRYALVSMGARRILLFVLNPYLQAPPVVAFSRHLYPLHGRVQSDPVILGGDNYGRRLQSGAGRRDHDHRQQAVFGN